MLCIVFIRGVLSELGMKLFTWSNVAIVNGASFHPGDRNSHWNRPWFRPGRA